MKLSTIGTDPTTVTTSQGLQATIRVLSVRQYEQIQLSASALPEDQRAAAIRDAALRASVVSLVGLEVDGAFVGSIDALVSMLDRLPASSGRAVDELFVLALGGASLAPDPSAPRSA